MARYRPGLHFIVPIALTSLFSLALCVSVAFVLYHQQQTITEDLSENLSSRKAASDLSETLADLIALLRGRADNVAPLHDRIKSHLVEIDRFANKAEEQRLARAVAESFHHYLETWQALPPGTGPRREQAVQQAADLLQHQTLRRCRDLSEYNARQIEESEQSHQRAVNWLVLGLVTVGGAGAVAGLVFGYGVARALRRTIHRLQIHVQDAAGKLGQEWPAIVLTEEGDLDRLHEQVQALVGQVEEVVRRLQQREREVLRADQLAAVGQLAASVAHEIRNPLMTIKMLVQGVHEETDGRALSGADLQVIEDEIRRIERLLRTFLDFARPPRLERAPLDLATLVEQTLGLLQGRADRQKVELRLCRPDGPVPVEADAEQLRQVLVNLALNALDALPRGGRLDVHLSSTETGQLEVSVEDSGAGITADMLPRLFTPFASSKDTGLGLGLVVSKRIVEGHGGQLWGANRPEGGARFTFRVPPR